MSNLLIVMMLLSFFINEARAELLIMMMIKTGRWYSGRALFLTSVVQNYQYDMKFSRTQQTITNYQPSLSSPPVHFVWLYNSFILLLKKEENIKMLSSSPPSFSLFVFLTGLRSLLLFTGFVLSLSVQTSGLSSTELSQRHLEWRPLSSSSLVETFTCLGRNIMSLQFCQVINISKLK